MNCKFFCPHCGQHISADSDVQGTSVDCPTCAGKFIAPISITASPTPERQLPTTTSPPLLREGPARFTFRDLWAPPAAPPLQRKEIIPHTQQPVHDQRASLLSAEATANIEKVQRPGIKAAAIFLIVNAVLTFLLTAFLQGGAANAVTTSTLYRSMFFGDIICALALLSGRDGWRWYVIARTIYGALYWVVLTPLNQGTAIGWLTGFAQLLFLSGLLALVLIKSPEKLRVRWAIASIAIALVSVSTLNAIGFVQFQQTKKTLLATMPWISPKLLLRRLKAVR